MIKINPLKKSNINNCIKLINSSDNDIDCCQFIEWSKNQIISQFSKDTNFSYGIYYNKKLAALLIGDLIFIEKVSEYEILLIYVNKTYRRRGFAHLLLNNIFKKQKIKLKKIYLEVAENNIPAINLYNKNSFKLIGVRKNYYLFRDRKVDALCYIKNL